MKKSGTSHAQVAAFLYRLAREPEVTDEDTNFTKKRGGTVFRWKQQQFCSLLSSPGQHSCSGNGWTEPRFSLEAKSFFIWEAPAGTHIGAPALAAMLPLLPSSGQHSCPAYATNVPPAHLLNAAALWPYFNSTTVTPSSPSPYRPGRKDLT